MGLLSLSIRRSAKLLKKEMTKLNEFHGNFVNAEMVKAFIVSGEYRHRFGL
jgi:hypothetical protein